MKLWLVSFLILFSGAEAIQWFAHLQWFGGVELSLPAVVMGGIGLAIASNYRQLQALGWLPETSSTPEISAPEETSAVAATESQMACPMDSTAVRSGAGRQQEASISFEIHKPRPISFEIRQSRKS